MSTIERCFAAIVGHEGGFAVTPADAGDWTGGACGSGQCLGTNWGISTASYAGNLKCLPDDLRATMPATVRDLSQPQALELFRYGYYNPMRCDALPAALALLVVDAAYNNGLDRAARWLQKAAGAVEDGHIGPATLAAVARAWTAGGGAALCIEVMALRIHFMAALPTWRTFGLGWSRRLAGLPYEAAALAAPVPPPPAVPPDASVSGMAGAIHATRNIKLGAKAEEIAATVVTAYMAGRT